GSTLAMRGVPMGVIAEQLGHADTRMTEKHYAHLAPSYIADTIRAHFPTLGIAEESTVTPIQATFPSGTAKIGLMLAAEPFHHKKRSTPTITSQSQKPCMSVSSPRGKDALTKATL